MRRLPLAEAVTEALADTATPWGSSRWGEYRRCQRSHALSRTQGVRLRERPEDADFGDSEWDMPSTSYFGTGRLCHSVLGFVQAAAMDQDLARAEQWEAVLDAAGESSKGNTEALASIYEAERLMGAYWAQYGLENAGWPEGVKIIGVEVPLETRSLGPLPYTARADTLLMFGDELVIADTKTRSSAVPGMGGKAPDPSKTERWARGLSTRPQFVGLSYLAQEARALREPPRVWVNAIIKTKIPQFQRVMLPPASPSTMSLWAAAQRQASLTGVSGSEPNLSECAPEMGSRCWGFLWCHGTDLERELHYETKGEEAKT